MEPSQTLLDMVAEIKKLKEENGDLNVEILILKAKIKELKEILDKDNNFFS